MAFYIALSISNCFSTPVLCLPVHILSPYPCMLVLYSAGPGFRWTSACPGEQMLESRNKLHRGKLLLVSWLVLSYLLVKQWHLTVGPWIKHPVQMLDEVCLVFFPNSFSERKLLLWYLSSEELPALCQRGRACWAGYVALDTVTGSKLTHCTAMEKRCKVQALLTHSSFYVDECWGLRTTAFQVILVIGTS